MFCHQKHPINRQFSGAQGEGILNLVVNRDTVLLHERATGVIGGSLISVKGNQFQIGKFPLAIKRM